MEAENESLGYQFYNQVRSGQLGFFDIELKLAQLTNNYDYELLKAISFDLGLYMSLEKEEIESTITPEIIEDAVLRRVNAGKEIPYYERFSPKNPDVFNIGNGKEPAINLEKLLYPNEFFLIYRLQETIYKKLMSHPDALEKTEYKNSEPQTKSNPGRKKAEARPLASYIKGVNPDKIKPFLEALKDEYKDSTPKEFTHMILALEELEYLKAPSRKELYTSFQDYFGEKYGSDTAKNNQYNSPDPKLLKKIKGLIDSINMKISYL